VDREQSLLERPSFHAGKEIRQFDASSQWR
jgi:hypothetical protein